jgi:integrase
METNQTVQTLHPDARKPRGGIGRCGPRKNRCMFQDEKNRWHLDYYTPDGKRRRKLVGPLKREAQALLDKIRVSKTQGDYVDPAKSPSFEEFCKIFMDRHGQHKRSYQKSTCYIDGLKSYFGKLRLSRITAGHIEAYRLKILEEKSQRNPSGPVSHTTVNRQVEILRAMLAKAVKWGLLAKNPATQVQDYDEDNTRERFLSTAEIGVLLRATKQSDSPILRPVVYLALQTGMRKAEMLNLRWSDVNFEANKILVRETKSGQPRQVPMSRRARWLFHKLAARAPLSEWVFESRRQDGTPGPTGDIKTAWTKVLLRAKIREFRFHDLRHTFASHFAMRRGDLYALAEILGHSNPKITLDRYAHLSPEFIQAQGVVIDAMYSNLARNGQSIDTEAVSAVRRSS